MTAAQVVGARPAVASPAWGSGWVRIRRVAARWGVAAVMGVAFVVGLCLLWELAKLVTGTDDSLMPHSWAVFAQLGEPAGPDGTWLTYIAENWVVTLRNAVAGFLAGSLLGVALGVWIASNRVVGAALLPITALMQTIPIVAIAPAMVLFLGTGWEIKAAIAAFLTFFPVTVATAKGIASTSAESLELMRVCAASPWQTLVKVRLPSALPLIFVGLETAAGVAVIGAIVAELPFGATEGLGMVILTSWQYYTIQPTSLYLAAIASCALGAFVVFAVRAIRTLVPAAADPKGA